jgi:hypothetical protein
MIDRDVDGAAIPDLRRRQAAGIVVSVGEDHHGARRALASRGALGRLGDGVVQEVAPNGTTVDIDAAASEALP